MMNESFSSERRGLNEPVSNKLKKFVAAGIGVGVALGMMGDFKSATELLMGAADVEMASKDKKE